MGAELVRMGVEPSVDGGGAGRGWGGAEADGGGAVRGWGGAEADGGGAGRGWGRSRPRTRTLPRCLDRVLRAALEARGIRARQRWEPPRSPQRLPSSPPCGSVPCHRPEWGNGAQQTVCEQIVCCHVVS